MREGPPAAGLRFGIFADDLTGALDAAAPFVGRGLSAYASLTADLPPDFDQRGTAVASVNMDSRRLSADHAAQRAYAAVSDLVDAGYRPALNKVDSTLRGHTGLEALVAARVGAARGILICPAFPANGRTVADGRVRVGGVPVDRTDVGRDALTPVSSSYLPEVVRQNCGAEATRMGLEVVRQGTAAVERHLDKLIASRVAAHEAAVVVADAQTDDHLGVLASAGLMKEPDWLLAGSAGLAAAIAAHLAPETSQAARPTPLEPASRPFLVVVGSQRKVAAESARSLVRSENARLVQITGERLLGRKEAWNEARGAARSVASHLRAGRSAVMLLDAGAAIDAACEVQSRLTAARDALVAGLGEIVSAAFGDCRPGALVIVGGDTATGVLNALGVAGIVLRDEPLPGAAAGVLDGGSYSGTPIVTKAGAFGDETTLTTILRYLEQGRVSQ